MCAGAQQALCSWKDVETLERAVCGGGWGGRQRPSVQRELKRKRMKRTPATSFGCGSEVHAARFPVEGGRAGVREGGREGGRERGRILESEFVIPQSVAEI